MHVHGHVQGVGFRVWARRTMTALGLEGTAENHDDGTVEVRVTGEPDAVDRLVGAVRRDAPGRVSRVVVAVEDLADGAPGAG